MLNQSHLLVYFFIFLQLELVVCTSFPTPAVLPSTPQPNFELNINVAISTQPATPSPTPSPSPGTNSESSCTLVYDLVRAQYDRYIELLQRGPSTFFLSGFFTAYAHALDKFVAEMDPDAPALGSVCLDAANLTAFRDTIQENSVYDQLELLRNVSTRLFYLPPDVVPTEQLPQLTQAQQSIVNTTWEYAEEALEAPPSQVFLKVVSVLPPGLKLFHDPRHDSVCETFRKFNIGPLVTSTELIRRVVGLVIRLYLLGVEEEDCTIVLRHCVVHVFNGIRCERKQNNRLYISQVYLPFYISKFKSLAPVGYETMVPEIPTFVIRKHYRNRLRILSSYNGWGSLEHLVFRRGRVVWRNVTTRIFKPNILEKVHADAKALWESSNSVTLPSYSELNGANGFPQQESGFSNWWVFRNVNCDLTLYYEYPTSPAATYADCCALFCQDTQLLALITEMTEAICCTYCNEDVCDLDENNPLSALPAIELEPYQPGDEAVRVEL